MEAIVSLRTNLGSDISLLCVLFVGGQSLGPAPAKGEGIMQGMTTRKSLWAIL